MVLDNLYSETSSSASQASYFTGMLPASWGFYRWDKHLAHAVIWIRKLRAQFSQNRILVIIKHLASYKKGDSFTFANFTMAHVLTGALYGTKAKNYSAA